MPRADISIHPDHLPQLVAIDGIRVREDVLYTDNHGDEKRAIRKRNEKQLRQLLPALQRILLPEEAVLSMSVAYSPLTLLEQLTSAWWTHYLARCVIVATNRRLLFFPVKGDGTWKETVRSASWGDLLELKPKGLLIRCVTFKFRNGSSATYTNFRRPDARKLAAIASAVQLAGGEDQSATQGLAQLCPDCRSVLSPAVYSCGNCGLIFKNEKTMVWRSIFLPGGGYFYTGHPLIALVPALIEAILIFEILVLLSTGMHTPQIRSNLASALLVLAFVWAAETAITILHCRRYVREYIPEKRDSVRGHVAVASSLK